VDIGVAICVIPMNIITELVVLGSLLMVRSRGWVIRSRCRSMVRSRGRVIGGRGRMVRGWCRVIRSRRGIGVTSGGDGHKGTD
jgi:hypothetical protein